MAAHAAQGVLLAKKFGGIFFIILGCLLAAAGIELPSTAMTVLGILFVIAGVILWVLKIVRRNESNQIK